MQNPIEFAVEMAKGVMGGGLRSPVDVLLGRKSLAAERDEAEGDPGMYMVDQDPGTIDENKEILMRLSCLSFGRQTADFSPFIERMKKEGRGL